MPINLSKAFRCHQVLLNHAKQKRKGTIFISPNSKTEMKAKKTLSLHICVYLLRCGEQLVMLVAHSLCARPICQQLKPRKASSSGSLADTAETLPMDLGIPDFDLGTVSLGLFTNTLLKPVGTPGTCWNAQVTSG